MSNYILDKAYTVKEADGVSAHRVVVAGSNPGECKLPSSANAGKILGVTIFSQPYSDRSVTVRKAGIARVVAAGAINFGDPVNIADSSGKVKAVNEPSGTLVHILGFAETSASSDGDIVEVFISIHDRVVP